MVSSLLSRQRARSVLQRERPCAAAIASPAGEAMRGGNSFQLFFIPAYENRIGNEDSAVAEGEAALCADGEYGPDQVLIEPHASGDAVHDDSGLALPHSRS